MLKTGRRYSVNCDILLKISPPSLEEIGWMKERQTLLSSFQVFTHKDEKYIRSSDAEKGYRHCI